MPSPEINELVKKIIPEFSENFGWGEFRNQIIESGYKNIAEGAKQLLEMRINPSQTSWRDSFAGANTVERALALQGQHFEYGKIKKDRWKKIVFEGNNFNISKLQEGALKLYCDVNNPFVVDVIQKLVRLLPTNVLEHIRMSVNLNQLIGSERSSSPSNLAIDGESADSSKITIALIGAIKKIRLLNSNYFPPAEKSIPDLVSELKLPIDPNIGVVEVDSAQSFDTLERNFMLAEICGKPPQHLPIKEKLERMILRFRDLSQDKPGLFADQNLLKNRRIYLPPLVFNTRPYIESEVNPKQLFSSKEAIKSYDLADAYSKLFDLVQTHRPNAFEGYVNTRSGFYYQVTFGRLRKRTDEFRRKTDAFRGYIQIHPLDIPRAIKILSEIAIIRLANNKRTEFKVMLGTNPSLSQKYEPKTKLNKTDLEAIGIYNNISPSDAELVIYGENTLEVTELLHEIDAHTDWQTINGRFIEAIGSLTEKFIPRGRLPYIGSNGEILSLSYNDQPGNYED